MKQNQRFCPNCGSTNVEFDTDHTNVIGDIIANQNKWLCNECGYRGLVPEGDPEEFEEGLEEEGDVKFQPVKQDRSIDTDLGRGEWKYLVYVTLPVLALYLIFKLFLA